MLIRQITIAFNVKLQDIGSFFCRAHVFGGELVDIFGSHLENEGFRLNNNNWMEWDIQLEFESWVSIHSSMEWGKCILMIWLVVDLPLWKIWKSVGMMTFPIYGKITNVPNHQPDNIKMAVPAGSSTWLGDVVQCLLQQKTKLSNLKHDFLEVVQYQIQYQPWRVWINLQSSPTPGRYSYPDQPFGVPSWCPI